MPWNVTKPIVVPFDFSEHAMVAVRKAIELTSDSQLIHCLHVLPFITPTEPGVVWGAVDDEERLKHALESMHLQLPAMQFGRLHVEVRFGDPGTVVADRAQELSAELIVIGSHGRSGLARWMLGSVAERVTRLARCPVLVIKLDPHPAASSEAHQAAQASPRAVPQASIA